MKYPVKIEGRLSADGYPLELMPPSDIVKEAADLLEPGSRVLDVGAYNGINGFYLGDQGHLVDSVEADDRYIRDGYLLASRIGHLAGSNSFIRADFRDYHPTGDYDAAIATKVLPYMNPCEAYQSIHKLKNAVRPGGLNVVSVYIAEHKDKASLPALNLFSPGELEALYKVNGWKIITYKERMKPIRHLRHSGTGQTKPLVGSYSEVIARKTADLKAVYLQRAAALEKLNPEQAASLRRQAETMPD